MSLGGGGGGEIPKGGARREGESTGGAKSPGHRFFSRSRSFKFCVTNTTVYGGTSMIFEAFRYKVGVSTYKQLWHF